MDPAALVKLALIGGIVLMVTAIGLRARPADALLLVRRPGMGLRAMIAMFVVVPGFVLFITSVFDLQPAVRAALLALSVAPMPPFLANKEAKAGGSLDYAVGLQVLASVVAIAVIPVMLFAVERVFGITGSFDPLVVGKLLLITVGAPLVLGMALGHWFEGRREQLARLSGRVGLIALAAGALAVVATTWPMMLALIGSGILGVAALVNIVALGAGQWLGGPDDGNRSALAIACAARHPGVAIAVASAVFPAERGALTAAVLLYLIANAVLTIPYVRWRSRTLAPALG